MPNQHHTTPFRRPAFASLRDTSQDPVAHDPADMGTEYGLELRLDGGSHARKPLHASSMPAPHDGEDG